MQNEKVWRGVERSDVQTALVSVQLLHHAAQMMQSVIEHTEFTNAYSGCWDASRVAQVEIEQELLIAQHTLECVTSLFDATDKQDKAMWQFNVALLALRG